MRKPSFMPFLFDSRDAWEKAIADHRYSYSMDFNSFMRLYQEYRNGTKYEPLVIQKPIVEEVKHSEILDQTDINNLFAQFNLKI